MTEDKVEKQVTTFEQSHEDEFEPLEATEPTFRTNRQHKPVAIPVRDPSKKLSQESERDLRDADTGPNAEDSNIDPDVGDNPESLTKQEWDSKEEETPVS